jgi:predicted DNA-binding transcriptional regulator YafY
MNRMDRLLGIVTTLQSKKFVPAEKIASKFNISIRTVYRDIKAMQELGIPISFETGKGYFVVEGYFLPPVSFTKEEARAILLMQFVVERFTDRSIVKHYTSAFDKIKTVMQAEELDKLEGLQQNTMLQTYHAADLPYEFLSIIQNGIANKTQLQLAYCNKEEIKSKRLIEPIGLIFYAFNWHVIAWCYERKEYRDFRVSRIVNVRDTEKAFAKKSHLSLNEYIHCLQVEY